MMLTLLASLVLPAWAGLSQVDAMNIQLIETQRLPPVALESYVTDPDAETRARAARALGRLRDASAVTGLRQLAADPDVAVRQEVAFALGQTPATTGFIVTRLSIEEDPDTRATLVEALGKQGDAQVIPMLMDALMTTSGGLSPSPEPAAAAHALGRLAMRNLVEVRTPLVAERLLAQLRRLDAPTRRAAAYALSRLKITDLQSPTRDRLLQGAISDRDAVVRAFLVRASGHLSLSADEADRVLGAATSDTAVGVRIAGARAAATQSWFGVRAMLDDEDAGVRREAIAAVGACDQPDQSDQPDQPGALELLQPIIDAGLDLEAAEAQRTDGDSRIIEAAAAIQALALADLLNQPEDTLQADRPTRIRVASVDAIDDLDRLVELALEDEEAPVRAAAAVHLSEKSTDSQQLVPLLSASDPIVAAIAAEHLTASPAPHIEDKLIELLSESQDAELLRAASLALASRYDGHPSPPVANNPTLLTSLDSLSTHADSAVRAAVETLRAALGLQPSSQIHQIMTAPIDEIQRIQGARIFTSRGEIRVDLLPEEAPLTVWNFAWLADHDFYDNQIFHRVVPDFVVQGGDPQGDGFGGPGWTIPDEINAVPYDVGVMGMALSGPDTGGSQWFITLSPQPHLDGGYTVFGRVTQGLGMLHTLQPGDRIRHIEIERSGDRPALTH